MKTVFNPSPPVQPNPPPKNQGLNKISFVRKYLIEILSLQTYLIVTLWGHNMACIYEVQYFLDTFAKKEKKWRLEENFHGIINADIVGIFKNFVF